MARREHAVRLPVCLRKMSERRQSPGAPLSHGVLFAIAVAVDHAVVEILARTDDVH